MRQPKQLRVQRQILEMPPKGKSGSGKGGKGRNQEEMGLGEEQGGGSRPPGSGAEAARCQ